MLALQVERNNVQSALRCIDCYEQGFIFMDLANPTGWEILYVSPQAALQTGMRIQACVLAIKSLSLPGDGTWKGGFCRLPALYEVGEPKFSNACTSACCRCQFRGSRMKLVVAMPRN